MDKLNQLINRVPFWFLTMSVILVAIVVIYILIDIGKGVHLKFKSKKEPKDKICPEVNESEDSFQSNYGDYED